MKDFEIMLERNEAMARPEVTITKISEGFGFGSGSISAEAVAETAGADAIAAAEAVILNPDSSLVAIDIDSDGHAVDDDGCSDGRAVKRVFQGPVEKAKSLQRPKVFGGGATMLAASMIGLGKSQNQPIQELFNESVDTLKDNMMNFGAHTSEHVAAGRESIDSGCGAIDRAPDVIAAIGNNREHITQAINALGLSNEGLDEVLDAYQAYAQAVANQPYAGRNVVSDIIDEGKIVKQLEGNHQEYFIIINMVRDNTINQSVIREATNDQVQAFVIDMWRLEDLSKLLSQDPREQHKALLSELVYTLGTSAVLTAGDQRIYTVTETPALVAA